ncbi:MAG: type IV secretion system DNA-binding domain-containing protein [Actinomycetota bacterium]
MTNQSPSPTSSGPIPGPIFQLIDNPGHIYDRIGSWLVDIAPWIVWGFVGLLFAFVLGGLARSASRGRLATGGRRIAILPPAAADPRGGLAFWMGLHSLLRPRWARLVFGQPHVAWEVQAHGEQIELSIWVPNLVPPGLIERAVEAAWPGARAVAGPEVTIPTSAHTEVTELVLANEAWFPIGSGPSNDAIRLVLAAMTGLEEQETAVVQILARPATSHSRAHLLKAARRLRLSSKIASNNTSWSGGRASSRSLSDPAVEADVRMVIEKASSPMFECLIRLSASSPRKEQARGRMHALAGSFAVFEGRNGFRRRRAGHQSKSLETHRLSKGYLLSIPELAEIATLQPAGAVPGLELAGAKAVAPSAKLPSTGKVLGRADHPSLRGREVAISVQDARHHLHVIGETGTGKSTLIAQMVLQDAKREVAAVVIDPKGDLVESIIERLPEGVEERTCLIDPDDPDFAVGLDLLGGGGDDLVVEQAVGVFRRIFEPWWGPRTDDIMRACCLTLRHIPGATVTEIPLLLTNTDWRREINFRLRHVVGLSDFWTWYDKLPERLRNEQIAGLLNKLRAVLLRGPSRVIIGQSKPKRSFESLLDQGGLVLVRIPKGTLGDETSRLLGGFVVARVWQSCMKRIGLPDHMRPDTTLYVDEMHNYMALPRSFEDLLAEARGYHLSLVLAHQHMGQLPRDMKEALGANARTKITFAVSPEDAHVLERHFAPEISAHDLSHLAAFQAACRPSIQGGHGRAFTFNTLPLAGGSEDRATEVRRRSAELFAVARDRVEDDIRSRQRTAVTTLLPAKQSDDCARGGQDQYGAQSGAQSGDPHGAQPRLRASEPSESLPQGA